MVLHGRLSLNAAGRCYSMAQRSQPSQPAESGAWYLPYVAWGLVGLAATLLVVLAILLLDDRLQSEPSPNVGGGRYRNAENTYTFRAPSGWAVSFEQGETVIRPTEGGFPAFRLAEKSIVDLRMLASWNCTLLPDFAPDMARYGAPYASTLLYTRIPCETDPGQPAHVQSYLALDDGSGRSAVLVMAPIDGQHWVVASTDPFLGTQWPQPTIDAMITLTTSVRRP